MSECFKTCMSFSAWTLCPTKPTLLDKHQFWLENVQLLFQALYTYCLHLIRHNVKKHGQLRIQIKPRYLFESNYECNSSVCCGYHVRVVTMEVRDSLHTHRYIQHAHTTHVHADT